MKRILHLSAALIMVTSSGGFAAKGCSDREHDVLGTAPDINDDAPRVDSEDILLPPKGGPYETCGHPKCSAGMPLLHTSCDPCVAKVCNAEPLCCELDWGQICLDLVGQLCNRPCSEPYSVKVKSSGKCLHIPSSDIFSGAYVAPCSGAPEQELFFTFRTWGTYDLVPASSGLCLGPDPWAHSDMEPQIVQMDCFEDGNIYPVYLGNGYYSLVDRGTGFCYEAVETGNAVVPLQQSICDGGGNQKFRFSSPP